MEVTADQLDEFEAWIVKRGRSPDTARQYSGKVSSCADDPDGLTGRIAREQLAPASRRQNLAALRAWAKFTGDGELRDQLDDVKLPPARRVKEKTPLSEDEWAELVGALERVDLPPIRRAAAEMICIRGFRVGDVCRLERRRCEDALGTGVLIYRGKTGRWLDWEAEPFAHCLELFVAQPDWDRLDELVVPTSSLPPERRWQSARKALQRLFPIVTAEAGLEDVSPHKLRRTYATHYLEEVGGDPVKLQKHMGWASIHTAMQYVDHQQRRELDGLAKRMRDRIRGR